MTNENKRKKYLIDKQYQLKLIAKVYLTVFISIIFLSSLLFLKNDSTLKYSAYQQILTLKSAREILLPNIITISLLTAVISFIIIFLRYLIESHRIAGPMVRFQSIMEQVGDGDLTSKLITREKDELQELKKGFNTMIYSLNNKVNTVKKDILKISTIIKDLRSNDSLNDIQNRELTNLLEDMNRHIDEIKTEN